MLVSKAYTRLFAEEYTRILVVPLLAFGHSFTDLARSLDPELEIHNGLQISAKYP